MTFITSAHDQGGFADTVPSPANAGRSRYCFLFDTETTRTENGEPGIFPDPFTDGPAEDGETVRLLLDFARWIEQHSTPGVSTDLSFRMQLPAAYTYFGQFVNHDISAPIGGMLANVEKITEQTILMPDTLPGAGKLWRGTAQEILDHFQNEHARPLRLDSLYGDGPFPVGGRPSPPEIRALYDEKGRFLLGTTCDARERRDVPTADLSRATHLSGAPDFPRGLPFGQTAGKPVALLADRRNDENLILSQLHLALMLLHNKAIDTLLLHPDAPDAATCFAQARSLITRHYHWCILKDFLPAILSKGTLDERIRKGPSLPAGSVPLEFTTAAFRFGHSMVSETYDFNENFGKESLVAPEAALSDLFSFTTAQGMGGFGANSPLPDHWVANWDRLTDPARRGASRSDKIDTRIAMDMHKLDEKMPGMLGNIVARNLVRGFHRRMPFGQAIAKIYSADSLEDYEIDAVLPTRAGDVTMYDKVNFGPKHREMFLTKTPAWLYFLCEAQAREQGERLGPTASRIVADTFVGLLDLDHGEIRGDAGRPWTPRDSVLVKSDKTPLMTLRDLLLFAHGQV